MARDKPLCARDPGLFFAPCFLSPLTKRRRNFLGNNFCCILGPVSRQPPLSEPLMQDEKEGGFSLVGEGRAYGDGTKVTERAQNADFRRKPQFFADSPLLLKFKWRRKLQIFAENRRFLQKTPGNYRKNSLGTSAG